MQKPIEKYEWKQRKSSKDIFAYDKERTNKLLIFIPQKDMILLDNFLDLSFEELQAIYETAEQIKEEYEGTEKETNENATEELKRYEEKNSEDYEEYKKAGYRELEKEEISKKNCWSCSHIRGGYIGAGCWCSQEKCDYKENDDVLVPQ